MFGSKPTDGWTLGDAPSLAGKVAVVTGATGGIGFEIALGLARRGATTLVAARNPAKGDQAVSRIRRLLPASDTRFQRLDLASLASVAEAANGIAAVHDTIDILVNNAGVMGMKQRTLTEDGFERQIGVNFLGHFALTARLKEALCRSGGGGRVVNVASLAHTHAKLDLGDLQSERNYAPFKVYGATKLAMLVFAIELQRRALQNGWNMVGIAAHPGWARTDIIPNGPGGGTPRLPEKLLMRGFNLLAQSARDGALPELYAAMSPEASGGGYYGPSGSGERTGRPVRANIAPQAADPVLGARLWSLAEKLTGTSF